MNISSLVSGFVSLAANGAGATVARKARSLGWFAAAGVLLLTAYVLATTSLVIYLASAMGLWPALAVAAVGFAILAGFVIVVALIAEREDEKDAADSAAARTHALLSAFTSFKDDDATRALLAAAAAGLISGTLFRKS